jgi:hypothetical protein
LGIEKTAEDITGTTTMKMNSMIEIRLARDMMRGEGFLGRHRALSVRRIWRKVSTSVRIAEHLSYVPRNAAHAAVKSRPMPNSARYAGSKRVYDGMTLLIRQFKMIRKNVW